MSVDESTTTGSSGETNLGTMLSLLREHNTQTSTRDLYPNGGYVKTSVDIDAIREAGIDPEDPPACRHHCLLDKGLIIIDLNSGGKPR